MAPVDAAPQAPAAPRARRWFRRGDTENLSWWQLLFFSLPSVPLAALIVPVSFLAPPFFTGEMGVSLTEWALIATIAKVWDLASDPIVASICDRYASRWGRRRHWVVIAAPFMMAGCALVYLPRLFTEAPVSLAYLLFAMIVLNFGNTIKEVNSVAWGGELSIRYDERSRILGWRSAIGGIAQLLAFGIPAIVEWLQPGASLGDKLAVLGWTVLILTPVTTFFSVVAVGEAPEAPGAPVDKPHFFEGVLEALSNRPLQRLIVVEILRGVPLAVMTSLNIFYVSYIIGVPELASTLLLGPFAAAMLAVPFWMKFAVGREKHKLLASGYLIWGLFMLPMAFLGEGDVVIYAVITSISGIFSSGPTFLRYSIISDVVDLDVAKTGRQRTGTFYAVCETFSRLAPALTVLVVYPLLQNFGFDPTGKNNTPESLNAVKMMYALAGTIPSIFAAWILWRFPLGRKAQAELRARIAASRPDAG